MAKTVGNTTGQPNDYTVDTGAGAAGADTQRVILASDDPLVDAVTSGQYTEDDAAPADPTGPTVMLRRSDSQSTPTADTEGDWVTGAGNGAGSQWVIVDQNAGAIIVEPTGGAMPVSNGGTFAVQDSAAETSLAVIDDWDESDRAKVNPIVGQAGIAGGSSTRGATTTRVTIATDDEIVASLSVMDDWDESDRAKVNPIVGQAGLQGNTGAVSASTVRVTLATDVALPAGTNAIGKLAANSGVDIGDVDVTSLPASTNTLEVVGDVAEGVALAGNPVRIGVRAETTVPTAQDDGDIVTPWATLEGAQVMTFSRLSTSFIPTIDTAVYQDLDRVGTVGTISNAGLGNGRSGVLVGAWVEDDALSNFPIELWFFQNSPTMANADNGVFDISDANIATARLIGVVDFWSANSKLITSNRSTPGMYLGGPCAMHYTCASGDSSIYCIARARGAYDAGATDDLTFYLELLRY